MSLGKALQRTKRVAQRDGRSRYRELLDAERQAALQAEAAHQEQSQQKAGGLKSIWETNDLDSFLAIADARETGYFAERNVRVVVGGKVHVVQNDKLVPRAMEDVEGDGDGDAPHATQRPNWLKLSESLTVPRRPQWDYAMSAEAVRAAEKTAFLDWRRSLAALEEHHGVLMTPYEKNLEVWRQLWRVVERADVIVVIVDARNPLVFRSVDFERYVAATTTRAGMAKRVVLLLNKADLLSEFQRKEWARYLESCGLSFLFFSAKPLASDEGGAAQESNRTAHGTHGEHKRDCSDEGAEEMSAAEQPSQEQPTGGGDREVKLHDGGEDAEDAAQNSAKQLMRHRNAKTRHRVKALRAPMAVRNAYELAETRRESARQAHVPALKPHKPPTAEERARDARVLQATTAGAKPPAWAVLNPLQLLDSLAMLRAECGLPPLLAQPPAHGRGDDCAHVDAGALSAPSSDADASTCVPLMIGLVGYPNVGKSSTINAIMGAKKVTVSATPGKTKHFQTLLIPNERRVALCDSPGLVFPSFASTVEQMVCDGILPIDTVTNMDKAVDILCRRLPRRVLELQLQLSLAAEADLDDSTSLAERLLNALARRRGYMAAHDRPNRARAGKELLKMYVEGRLLYVEPPPDYRPTPFANPAVVTPTTTTCEADINGDVFAPTQPTRRPNSDSEWDTDVEDEAWADLDSADEARALSEDEDETGRVGQLRNVRSAMEQEDERWARQRGGAQWAMFYARPISSTAHFTRYEWFNKEANELKLAALVAPVERRRRRKANQQLEEDPYTFVNREGEVELRLDDDDGVLELVTAGATRSARGKGVLSKRQQRREMKRAGLGPGVGRGVKGRIGIQGY